MNRTLWVIQILLALLFLFAGVMKFIMPMDQLLKAMPLSPGLIHFVAACEIAGAFGLILPRWLGIMPRLTLLAAAGLTIIMIGALTITLENQPPVMAVLPAITLVACAFVAYGRWRLEP